MKINLTSLLMFSVVAAAAFLGASALSAVAQTGSWTPPTGTPPGNNIDAPINVGALSQIKTGLLGLNDLIVENLTVSTGTPQIGDVLTTMDTAGTVAWGPAGSAPALNQLCTTTKLNPEQSGSRAIQQVSLLLNGKNMCTDDNGCSYRIWRTNSTYPAGIDFYGTNPVMFRQIADGRWTDASGNNRGNNGESTNTRFIADWANADAYDDYNWSSTQGAYVGSAFLNTGIWPDAFNTSIGYHENSPDWVTFVNRGSNTMYVTFCDL